MTFSSFGPVAWVLFGTLVVAMLIVDLRSAPGAHVGFRAAALRCVVWITVGLGFGLAVYQMAGSEAGLAYWAAYLLEQSPAEALRVAAERSKAKWDYYQSVERRRGGLP